MDYTPISIDQKFAKFSERFRPKVIAQMNDYQFKLVRVEGDFVWHSHAETDETFLVLEGELRIDFRDGSVLLRAGEMFVVPKGKEHKPYAGSECRIMLIEPVGTVNTGDANGAALTARMTHGSDHGSIKGNGMNESILRRFEDPDEVRPFEKGRFEIVHIGGLTIGRARYEPGWKWSVHVAPVAGTPLCAVEHVGLVVSGRAVAAFEDGSVLELVPGQLFYIPAVPHDSWVVGDEPYVSLHFLGADHYTK